VSYTRTLGGFALSWEIQVLPVLPVCKKFENYVWIIEEGYVQLKKTLFGE
jgi:hypothetical protein